MLLFVWIMYLSAAQDILKNDRLPAGVVLIADIAPALVAKYTMTRLVGQIANHKIVKLCCLLTVLSILMVITSGDSVVQCLLGVTFASFSSGLGESTFLTMTATASDAKSVVGWASGTGAAGLVGSIMYYVFTVVFGISPLVTLFTAICLPLVMWVAFTKIENSDDLQISKFDLLTRPTKRPHSDGGEESLKESVQSLFIPLFLIYLCEYTVNMGIVPLIASGNRRVYVGCQALYQMGVFTSRSLSLTVFPGGLSTAMLAILQALNLLTSLIVLKFNRSVLMAPVMVAEGLIGGAGYVMTYSKARQMADSDRLVSRVSMADCMGILTAGLAACLIEHIYYTIK